MWFYICNKLNVYFLIFCVYFLYERVILKLLYLTYLNSASKNSGVLEQQQYEHDLSDDSIDIEMWSEDRLPGYSVHHQYPTFLKFRILRKLFIFLYILRQSSVYDTVVLRYSPCDIFSILSSIFIKNIYFVHHTMEGAIVKNSPFSTYLYRFIEKAIGLIVYRFASGVIGVTSEIVNYEKRRLIINKPSYVYPNGISLIDFPLADDKRSGALKFVFVASYFHYWQGLEDLLLIMSKSAFRDFELHVIGDIPDTTKPLIDMLRLTENVIIYGRLHKLEIKNVIENMDVGLGSFCLDRVNMKSASTLKVREYLALGLPVFSGHIDESLIGLETYKAVDGLNFTMSDLVEYSQKMRRFSRSEVRSLSSDKIDKKTLQRDFISWLSK